MHETLYVPADANLGRDVLEPRIARVNKLYLNGWDDLNGNQIVEKTSGAGTTGECLAARLQLGEQALTGELGSDAFGQLSTDRDNGLRLRHRQVADRQRARCPSPFPHP